MVDRAPTPAWMKAVGLSLSVLFVSVVVVVIRFTEDTDVPSVLPALAPGLAVIVICAVLVAGSVSVTVRDDVVIRFYPVYRRTICFEDIESARTVRQSWFDFGGVGLRWRQGRTGLILGDRAALSITTSAGHEYVVQCSDPVGTAAFITQRLNGRAADLS